MRSRFLLALGVSTLTVATAAVSVPVFARSDDGAARAGEYVAKAERELARDKTERAVRYAEHAVEAAPLSFAARAMLARAYLADGRLNSAESATRDLLSLTPGDATATLNLALIRASLGQEADARALLASAEGLSPADKGLGLVLAGDVAGGGAILEAAARSSDADGRVRQNLAFAYAMAGDWRQARVVASQDLPPAAVHERIGEWAKVARPRNSWDRVAYLLNIQPVEDEGMPARLALQVLPAAPVLAAAVEPSPFAQELASYDDSDQQEVEGEAVDEPATFDAVPPPARAVYSQPVVQAFQPAGPATAPARAPTIRAEEARPIAHRSPLRPAATGRFVVQLGAYVTPGAAERGWAKAAAHSDLRSVAALSSKITVNGREFTRLSAGHFTSRGEATALCRSVQAHGGACFVRAIRGDDAPRWASRAKDALALR